MDFALTEEQAAWQELTRRFVYDELIPASVAADAAVDPVDCFSPELVRRASELGLRTLKVPKELGGHGSDCVTEVIVLEELCTGDVGFGMSLQHAWREGHALAAYTTDEQRERFLPDFLADPLYLTSLGITEPHFGSDSGASSEDPADGPRTTAVLDGDEWVLNGGKRWITNANVSRIVFLVARTDPTVPWRQGTSLFLVPTDSPGYKVGRIEDKLGIRMNPNAEIVLTDCRIPAGNLVGELNRGMESLARMSAGSKVKTATKAFGVARAAYEEALAYARERVQGGRRIIEHQAISSMFVDMEAALETTRAMIWRTAWCVDQELPEARRMETMSKIHASEMAVEVAAKALQVFGAYGVQRGRRIEKLMRDAAAVLHTGVGNQAARSVLAKAYAEPAG